MNATQRTEMKFSNQNMYALIVNRETKLERQLAIPSGLSFASVVEFVKRFLGTQEYMSGVYQVKL